MSNGGRIGQRNVPGVDGVGGVWSLREIANARRAGVWPGYFAEVMADAPISYWKLDETSGTTATDAVGGNNGTYTGGYTLNQQGIPSTGRPSVLFNGTSGYVDLGAPAALNLTTAWTLEAWVFLTSSTYNGRGILSELWTGGSNPILYGLGFGITTGGAGGANSLQVGYFTGSGWQAATAGTLTINTWHHVVGTWDGTTLRLYVDDAQVATATPSAAPVAGINGITIGRSHDTGGTPFFPGRIDEVAIYSTALSAARITAHYNAGIGA